MVTGGRSAEVRFEELHQLLRLASDLRDLPAGSEAQRREALRGLGALVGAEVGLWLEVEGTDTGQPVLLRAIDVGFAGERERRAFLAYLNDDQEGCSDPALARIARVARAPVFAVTRAELLDDRTWYASEHVQRYRRAAGVDGFIYAAASPSPGGAAQCISLHRPWGERPFSERERRLVEAFWRECAWLHAAPAPAPPESAIPANLPQRLRDTLRGLVRGLSEKQLADELGISPHTVHDYVKALHRRFHVRSRGELLALHLTRAAPRRAPAAPADPAPPGGYSRYQEMSTAPSTSTSPETGLDCAPGTLTGRGEGQSARSGPAGAGAVAVRVGLWYLTAARGHRMARSLAGLRIMVTGGAGFLGSEVVAELRRRGAGDIVIPRSKQHDLTDAARVRALFEQTRPDLVFHLAAKVGGIGANRRHPGTFFRDNMAMGLNVLEEARRQGTPKVVIAGTICAYPKFAPLPFREDDLWNGYPEETNAPYGVAKKALLVMAQAYRQEFGSNFVMIFPVNLYGPNDNFDLEDSHVIPAMIRKFVEAERRGDAEVVLWGDGSPTREFLYIADAARGLVAAGERYDDPDPVNLGAGFEIAMRDLAHKVAAAAGYRGAIRWDASRPNGQPRRMLDVSRARERFGFVAETSLDEGLARTIRWYREHREAILAREAARQ